MKHIVFTKDHTTGGLTKGTIRKLPDHIAGGFVDGGYAAVISEEEYEKIKNSSQSLTYNIPELPKTEKKVVKPKSGKKDDCGCQ